MDNRYRFLIAWITLVALVLFLVNPGYSVQTQDEKGGLQLIKKAEDQYNRFQIPEAINTFKEALKLVTGEKNLVRIHLGLARAHFAAGDNQNTEKSLEEMFKIKGDVIIRESEYADAFLEIFKRLRKTHAPKTLVKPQDQKVEKSKVIEQPLDGEKTKKKKKSPLLLILGGVAVVAIIAVVALGGKSSDNGGSDAPAATTVSVNVTSTPSGADIYIDGSNQGVTTPATITLSVGSHEIRLIKEGFGEAKKTFNFSTGQTYSLNTDLSPYKYEFVSKWGSRGSGDGQFDSPRGIASDRSNSIYVVDQFNHRIQKFDSNGTFVRTWGKEGSKNGNFEQPIAIAYGNKYIYVFDWGSNRIQKFNSSGTFVTKWGSNGSGNGQFGAVFGIAVDPFPNVYVSDIYNERVQKFSGSGTYLSQWGGSGTGDGQFDNPSGIAVDSSGNIWVVDYKNNRIQKFTSIGGFLMKFGSAGSGEGEFNSPSGIAIDGHDNIFVLDNANSRIQKFDISGNFIYTWGSKGSGNSQFEYPQGITVDGDGNIYVTDSNLNRVQKFKISTNTVDDGAWNQSAKKALVTQKSLLRLKNDPQKMRDLRKKRQEEKKSNKIKK